MKKTPSRKDRSTWTDDEKEFDRLVEMSESRDQVTRIDGRHRLNRFIEKHGKAKCDEIWEKIK